jgi:hypothetical protein
MKRGALRRGLPALIFVAVLIVALFSVFAVAETWSLIAPLNGTGGILNYAYRSAADSDLFMFNLTISATDIGNSSSNNVSNFSLYFGQPGDWRINLTNDTAWSNNTIDYFETEEANEGLYN